MKLVQIIDSAINMLERFQYFQDESQRKLRKEVRRTKRRIALSLMQGVLYFIGGLVLVVGVILFLTRYFSLDYIMLVVGALLVYIAVMIKVVSK